MKVPHSVFLSILEGKHIQTAEINVKKGEPFYRKATELYWKWLCKSFTDDNKSIKWCPELGCEYCILLKTHATVQNPVICECGAKFCIFCSKANHDPVTCEVSSQWEVKNSAESENVTWIMANTKNCPNKKCGKPIEKN